MRKHIVPTRKIPISSCFFLLITSLMLVSGIWYLDIFGLVGCDAILFTLTTTMHGAQSGIICNYLLRALPLGVLLAVVLALVLYLPRYDRRLRRALCILVCLAMAVGANYVAEVPQYVRGLFQRTELYAKEYVDPRETQITFPSQKRNLIYLYLESMETSFFAAEQGGMLETSRIPALYALAQSNLNFSQNDSVGGARALRGSTWTMGAMIAHSAGIPLRVTPFNVYRSHVPGAATLGDILHENGYHQALLVGSNASFGRRAEYFHAHGIDRIYDLYSARADGAVPEDYFVWWGMEDQKYYEYAKQMLTELVSQEQPFAVTMLTSDTHHVAGYTCPLCTSAYEEPYENVFACADRQAAAFIAWLQEQDFYENTTVIITGDHPSMDSAYFRRHAEKGYERHVYNCFLNAAAIPQQTKNRAFSTLDMFPTTLAAMGCTIEGERLGLGVNLFSGEKTLLERYGERCLDAEILKYADEYDAFQQ